MEDAAISELDIGNGNSIFAIFDGHGGNYSQTQVHRWPNLQRSTSSPD